MKWMATLFIVLHFSIGLCESPENFPQWIESLKQELLTDYNFSPDFLEQAFYDVKYNENVIRLDRSQPEFIRSTGHYLKAVISTTRVSKGQQFQQELASLFHRIKNDYNFPDRFLLAFWAMETNYSSNWGNIYAIESLATLAYDGRRRDFFKKELVNALQLINQNQYKYPLPRLPGSWAGALGSTQFMPSNILRYSIDYDNDGFIDMWNNRSDFLGSSASFLTQLGWNPSFGWGEAVNVPDHFDYFNSGLSVRQTIPFWINAGITKKDGSPLSDQGQTAVSLYVPQGFHGPKFLVYDNFFTILKWNNSTKYALGVSILSDLIGGDDSVWSQIDREESDLPVELIREIQTKLNELGYNVGATDGIAGQKTVRAIQQFQYDNNLIPDGYIDDHLLEILLPQVQ